MEFPRELSLMAKFADFALFFQILFRFQGPATPHDITCKWPRYHLQVPFWRSSGRSQLLPHAAPMPAHYEIV